MSERRDEDHVVQGTAGRAPSKLLGDPPLADRLLWRDPIRADTMISHDRGLIARAFGTLFLFGSLVGLLALAVGESTDRDDAALAGMAALALLLGAVCVIGYRRLPSAWFQLITLAGTAMITASVAASSDGAEGVYALVYVWIALLAGLFFTMRAAAVQIGLALAGYAFVLVLRDAEFAVNYLIVAAAVLFTSGTIIALLRARIEQLAANLASEAHTDKLTGLANRRGFDERFALELARAARSGRPLSLIVCDLDHFKAVNDELGHGAGDLALRRAARSIEGAVRAIDSVARPGGEEFAVLLPGTGASEALDVAERLRTAVLSEFSDYPVTLTASCGVATATGNPAPPDPERLFRQADAALYRAKRAGRNCTVAYDDSLDEAASSTK